MRYMLSLSRVILNGNTYVFYDILHMFK